MQGLVDYGSDSDEETRPSSTTQTQPQPPPHAHKPSRPLNQQDTSNVRSDSSKRKRRRRNNVVDDILKTSFNLSVSDSDEFDSTTDSDSPSDTNSLLKKSKIQPTLLPSELGPSKPPTDSSYSTYVELETVTALANQLSRPKSPPRRESVWTKPPVLPVPQPSPAPEISVEKKIEGVAAMSRGRHSLRQLISTAKFLDSDLQEKYAKQKATKKANAARYGF